jgi:hypothetical protein
MTVMPKSKVRKGAKSRAQRRSALPPPVSSEYKDKTSPKWYAFIMFGLMAIGVVVIVLNYVGLTPETNNTYLIGGLVAIAVGFMMTLNYH